MEALPPRCTEVFVLAIHENLPRGEIAESLARVTVTRHEVGARTAAGTWSSRRGSKAAFARMPRRSPAAAKAAWATAWRRGELIAENEPLGSVIATLGLRATYFTRFVAVLHG